MNFKVGNLIVLNEDGKNSFKLPSKQIGPIYCVVGPCRNNINGVYAIELSDKTKFKYLLSAIYYQLATESEIKTYKLKKMFKERVSINEI
jgi:hypothetical protein